MKEKDHSQLQGYDHDPAVDSLNTLLENAVKPTYSFA
jgi:hypothetical protein